jgi:hypothetical protein
MKRSHPPTLLPSVALALLAGVVALFVFAGCSEDGATPNCPAVPLYDIGAAGERNDAEDERKAAVKAGCLTDIDKTNANP